MPLSPPLRALIIFLLVSSVSGAAAETAIVQGVSRIYLRTGPGTNYEPDGVVVEGEPLSTLEPAGSWMKVETADGRVGYVYGGYLRYGSPEPMAVEAESAPAPVRSAVPSEAALEPQAPAGAAEVDAATTDTSLANEVAMLRTELERLRSDIASRHDASGGSETASAVRDAGLSALRLPTRGPVSVSPATVDGANLRTAGVALFALVIGWVFGASFSRRRTRSQRGRLRF